MEYPSKRQRLSNGVSGRRMRRVADTEVFEGRAITTVDVVEEVASTVYVSILADTAGAPTATITVPENTAVALLSVGLLQTASLPDAAPSPLAAPNSLGLSSLAASEPISPQSPALRTGIAPLAAPAASAALPNPEDLIPAVNKPAKEPPLPTIAPTTLSGDTPLVPATVPSPNLPSPNPDSLSPLSPKLPTSPLPNPISPLPPSGGLGTAVSGVEVSETLPSGSVPASPNPNSVGTELSAQSSTISGTKPSGTLLPQTTSNPKANPSGVLLSSPSGFSSIIAKPSTAARNSTLSSSTHASSSSTILTSQGTVIPGNSGSNGVFPGDSVPGDPTTMPSPPSDGRASTPIVAGAVVGSIGGVALIILIAVLFMQWHRNRTRRLAYSGAHGDSVADLRGETAHGGMSQRGNFIPATAIGFMNRISHRGNRSSTAAQPQERGFQKVAGRKLPSQFNTYNEGPTAVTFRNGRASEDNRSLTYYRDGQPSHEAQIPAGGFPPFRPEQRGPRLGEPGPSDYFERDQQRETLMPSPARTPVVRSTDMFDFSTHPNAPSMMPSVGQLDSYPEGSNRR